MDHRDVLRRRRKVDFAFFGQTRVCLNRPPPHASLHPPLHRRLELGAFPLSYPKSYPKSAREFSAHQRAHEAIDKKARRSPSSRRFENAPCDDKKQIVALNLQKTPISGGTERDSTPVSDSGAIRSQPVRKLNRFDTKVPI